MNPVDPPSGSEQGSGVLSSTTPTRKQGTLAQRWALARGGLPLEPEAGGGGAGSCSRHQLRSLPGGPWDGQVDWLQGDGVQVCVSGVCLRGLLQMEALFTCQRRLVSLPLGISVAGSRRS